MWIWSFALDLFNGDSMLTAVTLVVMLLTVLLAVVGICVNNAGLYAALCLLVVSGGVIFLLVNGVEKRLFSLMFAVVCGWIGIGYATVYICVEVRRKISYCKTQRAEIKRQLKFTLPDRENTYLRDRLHTALNGGKEEFFCEKGEAIAKMDYARRMLAQIREAPLTPIERIDVEEFARLLIAYERKGGWNASDVKAISEIFSRLLKLAAKYEVGV